MCPLEIDTLIQLSIQTLIMTRLDMRIMKVRQVFPIPNLPLVVQVLVILELLIMLIRIW